MKHILNVFNLSQLTLRRPRLVLMLTPQIKCHTPILNPAECLVAKRRLVAQKPNLTPLAEGKGQQFSKRP